MAFSLLKKFRAYRAGALNEFYLHISDLLENETVQQLDNYIQHFCFSRLKHSLDVAYCSFFIARLLGWDARSAARGGLLHDLFLYDLHDENYDGKGHATNHPKIALANAQQITALNRVEENIILRHMWLITLIPPRYKEGYIVTFVDKYCAFCEFFIGLARGKSELAKLPGISA